MPFRASTSVCGARRRALTRLRWAKLIACAWIVAGGCRSLSRPGPVSSSVATCRQLSSQGISALERHQWERAETLLDQAVQACPVDADARRHYAEALWQRGKQAEAVKQLEEAQRVASDDVALVVRTGKMHLAMGRMLDARHQAQRALELDSKSADAWMLRGETFQAAGQPSEALANYQRALTYCPGNPPALYAIAEVHRQLGQPEQALAALQSLLDSYQVGDEPQHLLYLEGSALSALNRHHDAVESFALAAQRGQPSPDLLCRLAEAELAAGRPASAHVAAMQVLTIAPDHPGARRLLDQLRLASAATPPPR